MIAVILYYIISTLVYLMVGTGSIYWAVFNMVSIMFSISYILHWFFKGNRVEDQTLKDWLGFMIILTFMRGLYSLICAYSPVEWIYSMNKNFATTFSVCLIIKIIISLKQRLKQSGIRYH